MFDTLLNGAILVVTFIVAIMPFAATAATIYLASVYYSDTDRPRNFILRAVVIDAFLATIGSAWWAFVALRRIFVGNAAPALPEWTLVLYGISIIMLTIIPIHKFFVFKKIERLDREKIERETHEDFSQYLTDED